VLHCYEAHHDEKNVEAQTVVCHLFVQALTHVDAQALQRHAALLPGKVLSGDV